MRRVAVLAGPAHEAHVALCDPFPRGIKKCVSDGLVVDTLEEAEESNGRAVVLVVAVVDRCRDRPDYLAAAAREEMGDVRERVVGVLGGQKALRAEQLVAEVVGHKRWRPAWIPPVQPPREAGELADARVAEAELLDGDGGGHGWIVPQRCAQEPVVRRVVGARGGHALEYAGTGT